MAKKENFKLKEEVYLKTDAEQSLRIITGINIRETGKSYCLAHGRDDSWHFGFEMSREKKSDVKVSGFGGK